MANPISQLGLQEDVAITAWHSPAGSGQHLWHAARISSRHLPRRDKRFKLDMHATLLRFYVWPTDVEGVKPLSALGP
eukprot:2817655-Amphidinium_carterae.1